jgi:hypothetical protein
MSSISRAMLALPFLVAGLLNVLLIVARPLHWRSEHIEAYVFSFSTPWAWLLDRGWFPRVNSRWLETLIVYLVILWIPALLYSVCFWLLLRAEQFCTHHHVNK